MIQKFIDKWHENKNGLEKIISEKQWGSYEDLVKEIIVNILNVGEEEYDCYDVERLTTIDDGDYQGTQLFIFPTKTYQPGVGDYIITHNYYGSCSGCDTLLSISEYSDDVPTKEQVEDYMSLCLHLIEKMKVL